MPICPEKAGPEVSMSRSRLVSGSLSVPQPPELLAQLELALEENFRCPRVLPSTQAQPLMRPASLIAKRSALPTSAAATSSLVGFWEDSSGTAARATIPISTATTRVSRSVNPREDRPDCMRAAHRGRLKCARQWVKYG